MFQIHYDGHQTQEKVKITERTKAFQIHYDEHQTPWKCHPSKVKSDFSNPLRWISDLRGVRIIRYAFQIHYGGHQTGHVGAGTQAVRCFQIHYGGHQTKAVCLLNCSNDTFKSTTVGINLIQFPDLDRLQIFSNSIRWTSDISSISVVDEPAFKSTTVDIKPSEGGGGRRDKPFFQIHYGGHQTIAWQIHTPMIRRLSNPLRWASDHQDAGVALVRQVLSNPLRWASDLDEGAGVPNYAKAFQIHYGGHKTDDEPP